MHARMHVGEVGGAWSWSWSFRGVGEDLTVPRTVRTGREEIGGEERKRRGWVSSPPRVIHYYKCII
jgi:hypothetical protein